MPMIPEAVFAMLACARIGAIHSVVFGGFASVSLASRIDDAEPKVIVSADAGSRAGKVDRLQAAARRGDQPGAAPPPAKVLLVDRGLAPMARVAGRDDDYAACASATRRRRAVRVARVDGHPSYTLYTSGTTGRPKGVQRDTGGYAVALAASMKHIFCGQAGETYFSTSDIGWVVGHSYIVYGPLIAGMATILYEGLPIRPDAGIWWRLVEKYQVTAMFTAPTAIRVLKKQDPAYLRAARPVERCARCSSPASRSTSRPHRWIAEAIGKPVIDNYWQTESGWPILTRRQRRRADAEQVRQPGRADVRLRRAPGRRGDRRRHRRAGPRRASSRSRARCRRAACRPSGATTRASSRPTGRAFAGRQLYTTFDWGIRDADGYYFILGRTDDVINVAGHRLGTREIEESISSHAERRRGRGGGRGRRAEGPGGDRVRRRPRRRRLDRCGRAACGSRARS